MSTSEIDRKKEKPVPVTKMIGPWRLCVMPGCVYCAEIRLSQWNPQAEMWHDVDNDFNVECGHPYGHLAEESTGREFPDAGLGCPACLDRLSERETKQTADRIRATQADIRKANREAVQESRQITDMIAEGGPVLVDAS